MKTCAKCRIKKASTEFYHNHRLKDGLYSYCKSCCKIIGKEWRESKAGKAWWAKHSATEERKEACRIYKTSEQTKETNRRYDASDKGRKWRRAYNKSEKSKEALQKYATSKKGKETRRRNYHKRRALKFNVPIDDIDVSAVYALCENKCVYCGSKKDLELDHVVALSEGGPHIQSNLVVACKICNSSKGAKPLVKWLAARIKDLSL